MNENQDHKSSKPPKRNFSLEEKRNYYIAWEKSEMTKDAFCKANGVSKSALYQWIKEFKKENNCIGFSPLVLDKQPPIKQTDTIQLNICFPNQMQLTVTIPEHRLVSFIQEISYATTVIR